MIAFLFRSVDVLGVLEGVPEAQSLCCLLRSCISLGGVEEEGVVLCVHMHHVNFLIRCHDKCK